jgi:hypothetical protein
VFCEELARSKRPEARRTLGEKPANERLSPTARIVMAISQFANERGIYLGRRSSRLHVALYRLTGGRLGGHHPGLPGARIALSTTLEPKRGEHGPRR